MAVSLTGRFCWLGFRVQLLVVVRRRIAIFWQLVFGLELVVGRWLPLRGWGLLGDRVGGFAAEDVGDLPCGPIPLQFRGEFVAALFHKFIALCIGQGIHALAVGAVSIVLCCFPWPGLAGLMYSH